MAPKYICFGGANMKHQSIGCHVDSCQYHRQDCSCGLDSIQVRPCGSCLSGKAEDETQCASYRRKQG